MRFLDHHWDPGNWVWHRVVAPLFGTVCFVIGASALFLVSLGRWRVRRWPTFSQNRGQRLEPWKTRVGAITYFCADAALFVGFAILVAIPFAVLGVMAFGS